MVNWLHQQQCEQQMTLELPYEGVVLKQSKDYFTCSPPELRSSAFYRQVIELNVKVSLWPA